MHRTTRRSDDTGIGLLFVGMLALGVRDGDLWLGLGVLAVTAVGLALGHRAFLALAVNRDKAVTLGLRRELAHATLLVLLAASIVSTFGIVGTLLVLGLLVAPPATAVLLVRRILTAMAVAVVVATSPTLFGGAVTRNLQWVLRWAQRRPQSLEDLGPSSGICSGCCGGRNVAHIVRECGSVACAIMLR